VSQVSNVVNGSVEQNVGIIIVNVPPIRPLFSRAFAVTRKDNNSLPRYNNRGYRMGTLTRISGSNRFSSRVLTIAARGPGHPDPSGSESSLVARNFDGGITKTVGVSVHSFPQSDVQELRGADEHSNLDHQPLHPELVYNQRIRCVRPGPGSNLEALGHR